MSPSRLFADGEQTVRHWLVLPDGSEIGSGTADGAAILGLTLEESVNDDTELMPGAACAACIEADLWAPSGGLSVTAGQELACYRQEPGGVRTLLGRFIAEQPTRAGPNTYHLTAYDRLTRADKDLSGWLRGMQARFPLPLGDFAAAVCAQCGLELTGAELPNRDFSVQAFYADGLTGRQLLQWIGQAAGRFCRATPDGKVEFAWYTPVPGGVGLTPGGGRRPSRLRLAGRTLRTADQDPAVPPDGPAVWRLGLEQGWYFRGSLQYEDFATATIDKVQIRQSDDDVGVVYPPEETGDNALVLSGNLLLAGGESKALQTVAQTLFEQFRTIRYTPCRVTAHAAAGLRAGRILQLTDATGRSFTTYLMDCTLENNSAVLTATGSARRDAATAVNLRGQRNLQGKVLELETSVDGLRVTASDLDGHLSELEQKVDGFRLTVDNGETSSTLHLTAGETTLSSARITFSGFVTFQNLAAEGQTTIHGGNIETGTVTADKLTVADLNAFGATIGGWKLSDTTIEQSHTASDGNVYRTVLANYGGDAAASRVLHCSVNGSDTFSVHRNGRLYAQNADISGTVRATSGSFSSVTISGSTITGSTLGGTLNAGGTFTGSLSSVGGTFTGTSSGTLTGTHSNGTVSSCTLGGTSLTTGGGSGYISAGSGVLLSGSIVQIAGGGAYTNFSSSRVAVNTSLWASGSISCDGTKSRAIATKHFGTRCLDAFETPTPTFADYGRGTLDASGVCTVVIDPVFAETVDPHYRPTVFLTRYGAGEVWLDAAASTHDLLIIRGTPGLTFAWQALYQQTNCGQGRLRQPVLEIAPDGERDFAAEAAVALEHTAAVDYAAAAQDYLQRFERSLSA